MYQRRYSDVAFTFVSFSKINDDVILLDNNNLHQTTAALRRLHEKSPFGGVLNRREKFVIPASIIAKNLNLLPITGNPYLARDKHLMLKTISKSTPCARTILLKAKNFEKKLPDPEYPCVIKPRYGFNSRCARKIETRKQLKKELERHFRIYASFKHEDIACNDFVAETYIGGTEHTVEALVKDSGIILSIISDKNPMKPPFFIEVGDTMPSRLPETQQKKIQEAAGKAISSLGIKNGWTHIEVKIYNNKIYIIEAAARMGGGYFEEMIQEVYGIDRMRLLIDIHLQKKIDKLPLPLKIVNGRRIVSYGMAYVLRVYGVNKILENHNARLVWPGNPKKMKRLVIGPPYDYKNTIFEYFITGQSMAEIENICRKLDNELMILKFPVPSVINRKLFNVKQR